MKSKFICYIICFLMLSFSGCIEEYTPKDIKEIKDLLVVDGTITNGESVFKISRSVGLSEQLYEATPIYNAEVYVETDSGDIFPAEEEDWDWGPSPWGSSLDYGGDGGFIFPGGWGADATYTIQMGELDPDKKYRLHIAIDNEIYKSNYLSPLISPPIDNVFSEKPGDGKPVSIYVSTHDPQNQSKFYKWSYEEHWEIRAELVASSKCWGKDQSKTFLLGGTDKISENIISRQKINEINPSNEKLSILYYISVKQTLLRNEAYAYYRNLQKNVELTGGLFSAMPSEMKGNIECITDPDTYVIGYIEVATITEKSLFINPKYYEPIRDLLCYVPPGPGGSEGTIPLRCTDCRFKPNASQDKPDFWPQ